MTRNWEGAFHGKPSCVAAILTKDRAMGLFAVLYWGATLWILFFLVMKLLEYLCNPALYNLLERLNISVSLFHIRWYTTKLNPLFYCLGSRFRKPLDLWFSFGVWFGLFAIVSSLLLLVVNLYWSLQAPKEVQILTPVIPGVNVPSSHIVYYFLALIISGVLHEIGHAIAVTCQKGKVNGFGMFLLYLYPGAFVDIGEELEQLTPLQQLKIFCAGAWHNFVVAVCGLALLLALPLLLSPLYTTGSGGVVTRVAPDSPLAPFLAPGDVITALDGCPVRSLDDWYGCARAALQRGGPRGYCMPMRYIRTAVATDSEAECCRQGPEGATDSARQCYRMDRAAAAAVQSDLVCLPARGVAEHGYCDESPHCRSRTAGMAEMVEPSHACLTAQLPPSTHLLKVVLSNGTFLLFEGPLEMLLWAVEIGNYRPRPWAAAVLKLGTALPRQAERILRYLVPISAALALLNMAPVVHLDGQWATAAFVRWWFAEKSEEWRLRVCRYCYAATTVLFALNMLVSFYSLYVQQT